MDVEGIDPVAVYAALMSTLVRTVFAQPNGALAWAQHALLSTSGGSVRRSRLEWEIWTLVAGGSLKMLTWGRANGSAPVS
jgi:hypothetical protein